MRVHVSRRVSRRPLAIAIGVSVGLHLLLLAVVLLVRPPANPYMVKRGEPLFIELPKAEGPAERGAPPAPSPTPKGQPAPPTPEPPAADGLQASTPPSKPAEPVVNEPVRPPEAQPREAAPAAPPPPQVAAVPPSPPLIDSRSALRRGGPAGAGGAGEGWAGIEGEPIPLDSADPKYNDYLERVRRMIKEKWGYPCIKDVSTGHCDYKSARLKIVFGILRDGRVPMLEIAQQSGYPIYDDYAANAIRLAQPFPPVPASLLAAAKSGSTGVKIEAAFQYVLVESSLTNILR